jgi:hypothetical protein
MLSGIGKEFLFLFLQKQSQFRRGSIHKVNSSPILLGINNCCFESPCGPKFVDLDAAATTELSSIAIECAVFPINEEIRATPKEYS